MKTFVILKMLVMINLFAWAQSKTDKKLGDPFLCTFFGGANASTISGGEDDYGNDDSYNERVVGSDIGVGFPLFAFNQRSGMAAELAYGTRGSKYEETYVEGKVVLSYLMMPLFARYLVSEKIFGEAGLQPAFLLSAKDKYDGNSDSYKDHINSFDMSVLLGAGYIINSKVGVGLRFSRGITNIVKSEASDAKNYNSSIGLRLMWFWGTGGKKKSD